MKKALLIQLSSYLALCIPCFWYFFSLNSVPFHPDESTYRFMSRDLDIVVNSPSQVFYTPGKQIDLMMHYRLVDPPIGRYLTWVGMKLSGFPFPSNDWNWSKSWNENGINGALPTLNELLALRLPTVLLLSISIFIFYRITQVFQHTPARWIATLLYALSPLLLLHGRRAMSEGAMLFSITLAIYFLNTQNKHPWLSAIPLAIVFNSKQSTLPLIAVFFLVMMIYGNKHKSISNMLKSVAIFCIIFIGITYLLNPIAWIHPIETVKTSILERQSLVASQVDMLKNTNPEKYLGNPLMRGVSVVVNLFLARPATADVANYLDNTRDVDYAYLTNPINTLFTGIVPGVIYLIIFIFTAMVVLINYNKLSSEQQRFAAIAVSGFSILFIALSLVVPIPYQRYCVPLLPFMVLIVGQGLDILFTKKAEFRTEIPLNDSD